MVNSFNYGFHKSELSISQRQSIIRPIPKKKKKKLFYLKNWRPISLLIVDYKIASKTLALRLNKVHQRFAKTLGLSKLIFVSLCVHTPPHYIEH